MLNLQLTADLASSLPPANGSRPIRSRSLAIDASDWPGVVAEVRTRFPDLASRIFAENGKIQQGFLVAVNSEVVDHRVDLYVQPGDELFVFPQISGG
jgi:molybdopterin converting factor small subunit